MLKGSEKQVAWAKRIKQERLASWKQSDPAVFKEVEPQLKDEQSAAWWITYREKNLGEVLPYIASGGAPVRKSVVKPKETQGSASLSPVYSSLEDVIRFVGETRSIATGKVVVDADCPF